MSKKEENKETEKQELEELTPEELKNMTEEQLENLLKELGLWENVEKNKKRQTMMLFFNYALHKNFGIHIFLQTVINILAFSAVLGITRYGIIPNIRLYFLSLVLFTAVEIITKLILFRFFQKIVISSFGTIHLIYLIPFFYLFFVVIGNIDFIRWYHLIISGLFFYTLRFFTSYYVRLLFLHKKN